MSNSPRTLSKAPPHLLKIADLIMRFAKIARLEDTQCDLCKVSRNGVKFTLSCGHKYDFPCLREFWEANGCKLSCALCGDLDDEQTFYCRVCDTWSSHSWETCSNLYLIKGTHRKNTATHRHTNATPCPRDYHPFTVYPDLCPPSSHTQSHQN
jgi:hypothetical protein